MVRLSLNDPAGATRLIIQYEKALVSLMQWYRQAVTGALKNPGRILEAERRITINTEQYMAAIQNINLYLSEEYRKVVERFTEQGYFKGVTFAGKGLKPYRIDVNLKLPYDAEVVKVLTTRNHAAIKGVTDAVSKEIGNIVTQGALNGETVEQIAQKIAKTVDTVGINRARTIARTELMTSVNEGVRRRFVSSGIEKLKRVETKDERTCTDWTFTVDGTTYRGCRAIDGKVFTMNQAMQIDAQTHPNCRGTWVPWIEGVSK